MSLPSAAWDAASQASAVARAEGFIRAYARADLTPAQWWDGVAGFLSPDAQHDYQGTDPSKIPPATLTGRGVLISHTGGVVAVVALPTPAGTFQVTMTRADSDQLWLVSLVSAPQGVR